MPEKEKEQMCYCGIPEEKLRKIVHQRFIKGIPTEELMIQADTQEEREYVAAVALLDVKEEELADLVVNDPPGLLDHLYSCRRSVQSLLKKDGIRIAERH